MQRGTEAHEGWNIGPCSLPPMQPLLRPFRPFQQWGEFAKDFIRGLGRQLTNMRRVTDLPIETTHLICQHCARDW